MPPDVFKALDEIEYGFIRERVEAEFASEFPLAPTIITMSISITDNLSQSSTRYRPQNVLPTAKR